MKLIIDNLSKQYDHNQVLDALSYTFEKGKIYALLGRNGSGKTTLFNCIASELEFDSGTISLDDQPITNQDVGYVYTDPMLPEFLTGYEF